MKRGTPLAVPLTLVFAVALGQTGPRTRPAISVSLSPPFIEKLVRPSSQVSDTIALTNDSLYPVEVRIDFADFRVNDRGEVEEMPPGTDPSSISPYLRITPLTLKVNPHQRAFFRYTVQSPTEFRQLRGQIFFSSSPILTHVPNQLVFVPRMGVPLYVESMTARPARVKVDQVQWSRLQAGDALLLELQVSNEGERNIRPKGFVEVRSSEGKFSKVYPFNPGNEPLLPGQKRDWKLAFGPVPGGELLVRLRFETAPRTSFDHRYRISAS